jgi:hypothetical protein
MPYLLGAVKPHVKMAADTLGPKYGFTVIYGLGPGSIAGSDHPKGLALDFMTSDKGRGDSLVADLIANAGPYAVKYIVWYRRSWNPKRGTWAPYKSTPNPHTDHVHVSFEAKAGDGAPSVVTPSGLPGVPGVTELQTLMGIAQDFNAMVSWLTKAENWRRIGIGAAGAALVLVGMAAMAGKSVSDVSPIIKVVGAVKSVGKVAK